MAVNPGKFEPIELAPLFTPADESRLGHLGTFGTDIPFIGDEGAGQDTTYMYLVDARGGLVKFPDLNSFYEGIYERAGGFYEKENVRLERLIDLHKKNIAIVGGGTVGSQIAIGVASLHPGIISIIDADHVASLHNIERGEGYDLIDLAEREQKVVAVAREIQRRAHPDTKVNAYATMLTKETVNEYITPETDVALVACDNIGIMFRSLQRARELCKPAILVTDVENSAIIDVFRFDQDPEAELFNGRIKKEDEQATLEKLESGDPGFYLATAIRIVGAERVSPGMLELLEEIMQRKRQPGFPQKATAARLARAGGTAAIERVLLDMGVACTGIVDIDDALDTLEQKQTKKERKIAALKRYSSLGLFDAASTAEYYGYNPNDFTEEQLFELLSYNRPADKASYVERLKLQQLGSELTTLRDRPSLKGKLLDLTGRIIDTLARLLPGEDPEYLANLKATEPLLGDGSWNKLIEAGIKAPSPHNNQPFQFSLNPEGNLVVQLNTNEVAPVSDRVGRQAAISIGAVLANIEVQAKARGQIVGFEYVDDPSNTFNIPKIEVKVIESISPNFEDEQLANAIYNRTTDRDPYLVKPLPEAVINLLEDHGIHLLTTTEDISTVANMARQSRQQIVAQHPAFIKELAQGHVVTPKEGYTRGAGMLGESQDIPRALHGPIKYAMTHGMIAPAANQMAAREYEKILNSGAIGVTYGEDNPMGWIEAGKKLQKGLLIATRYGLRTYPFAGLVEEMDETPIIKKLRYELASLMNLPEGQLPIGVFKVGYPKNPQKKPRTSPRKHPMAYVAK